MRIHRLRLEGIGPFKDEQSLDFDELTAQGLFLLTGPTGAGKTTLLDAVVFALYGTVPGARGGDGRGRRVRERIVSDLRDVDTQPKVELEFSAAGRRFIVIRSPDYERPKSRGTGTTLAKASATLEEQIDGDWVPRSTDFQEISVELQGVLGMNAEQFAQVVLLPQGEFAGFLRASVTDRRRVLERLFQVDRYQSAEDWFRARADEAKLTLADARAQLDAVVERLAGALGTAAGPEDVRRSLSGPDEIGAWVASRRQAVDLRLSETEREANALRKAYAVADEAHRRAVQIEEAAAALQVREDAFAAHDERLPRARAWMAGAVGHAIANDDDAWAPAARDARARASALDGRLADERRAPTLIERAHEEDRAADGAEAAAELADASVAQALGRIEPARGAAEAGARAEETVRSLEREREVLTARMQAAERRAALAVERDAAAERLAGATESAAKARAAVAEHRTEAELDAVAARLLHQRQELSEARAALEADVRGLIEAAEAAARDRASFGALSTRRAELQDEASARRSAHLTARAAHLQAREDRLNAMAAELAAELSDGCACPVCGALDHPAPAGGDDDRDLRGAEQRAEAAASEAEQRFVAAQQALDTCNGQLAGLDAAEIEARSTAVAERGAARRAALQQLAADEHALGAEITQSERAIQARRQAVRDQELAERAASALEREIATIDQALATATAHAGDGPAPAGELEQLDARLIGLRESVQAAAAAREQVTRLEAAAESGRAESAARRAAAASHRQAARSLREEAARIESELAPLRGAHASIAAAAQAAGEHARSLEAAVQLLSTYAAARAERDAAAAHLLGLTEADTAAPGSLPTDSTDPAERTAQREARRNEASESSMDAAAHHREATRCAASVAEAEASLERAANDLGPATEAAERVIRLDATVRGGGDNLRKISLATYVLAARLEEVAAAATNHLLRMSSGRYELLHHDDRYGGGPAGLGLRVRDGWTGEERDTATLSGGEAFYASLALALGLAEVVTHESGGRPLDTLLVDEGFGSLDADTLEEVLGELDQLRAAGRSIGLVSHVPALAERIPAQLQVTPGRGGSTATVVTAVPA